MSNRYVLTFPSTKLFDMAATLQLGGAEIVLTHRERLFISVRLPLDEDFDRLMEWIAKALRHFGDAEEITIVRDYQYSPDRPIFDEGRFSVDSQGTYPGLPDVLDKIRAREAWDLVDSSQARGRGVAIAIVDSGIEGSRREFPNWKRFDSWAKGNRKPWRDNNGHGTMCAAIAAGTSAEGGLFDGVAPDAELIACKTAFFDAELTVIYDFLAQRARETGKRIVVSNSFGVATADPPSTPSPYMFFDALARAIESNVVPVFAAGNNHVASGTECKPNSIWLFKSRPDVLTVAACDLNERVWDYSSRGPGQDVDATAASRKPDVTAPTPAEGCIPWSDGLVVMPSGWGTSGSCPQVAGLAALLLAKRPTATPNEVRDVIRSTAKPLGSGRSNCAGYGLIDCAEAVRRF